MNPVVLVVLLMGQSQPLPPAAPLTLEAAIAQALANSQRIAELQARGEAAEFQVAGRRAADLPSVALQGGYTRTNHVDEFAIALPGRAPQVVGYPFTATRSFTAYGIP